MAKEPTKTLEAPAAPAPLMNKTPKQRADLKKLGDLLRADQPGEVPEPEEDFDEPEEQPVTPQEGGEKATEQFGLPEWFKMPPNGFPGDVEPGTPVIFLRFPTWVTDKPKLGERQCAVRPMTPKLERFARSKVSGESRTLGNDLAEEYAKAMICVVDGHQANLFAAGPGSINHFWADVGPKGRELLLIQFNKLHRLSTEDRTNFLANCVALRIV